MSAYGEPPPLAESDGRVVSDFICQAIRGEPHTLYGEGRRTRSFCYVDDLVEGLIRRPDISPAQRLLGWSPTVELRRGLERTIAHFTERLRLTRKARRMSFATAAPIVEPRRAYREIPNWTDVHRPEREDA